MCQALLQYSSRPPLTSPEQMAKELQQMAGIVTVSAAGDLQTAAALYTHRM